MLIVFNENLCIVSSELSYKLGFKSEKDDYDKFHCIGNINLFISRFCCSYE